MSKYFRFLILAITLLSACGRVEKPSNTFNRDTALKQYLQFLDTLPIYDTTDPNYKALKAYQNNDSSFFQHFFEEQKRETEFSQLSIYVDSCVKLKKLEDLNVHEAYRFEYIAPFCSMPIVATVTKKDSIVNLHFIVYQTQHDTVPCTLITEINKPLTLAVWETFYLKLMQADIWGLKRENGISGVDGSTMTFTALEDIPNISRSARRCYVKRWFFSTLRDAFDFSVALSGNTKGCYRIKQRLIPDK